MNFMIFQTCVNIFFFLTACLFIFLVFHNRLPNEILHSTGVVAFISNELIKNTKESGIAALEEIDFC